MIRFGTSGWRAIIAEEVTIASVRRLADAVAGWLQSLGQARRGVFVGHDTRFLSDRFAREAAQVLAAHRVPVTLSSGPLPTPAVAHAVLSGRRAAGVHVTAGHHPPEYSGVKIMVAGGAPAPPEVTHAIEQLANDPANDPPARTVRIAAPRIGDVRAAYFRQLASLIRLPAIRRARLKIACDPRHGASTGYLDRCLAGVARTLDVIHGTPHPEFAGEGPDCGEAQLRKLARVVRRGRLHLGLATDGDGDRFGIIDAGGAFIPPSHFLALTADYLLGERGMAGGVARTVATTHLLDAVCARYDRPLYETSVGFRHLAGRLVSKAACLACEESGGLGLAGHVPDKDGLLAGLLAAEMVAVRRRPLRDQIRRLLTQIGPLHNRRIDYHTEAASRDRLLRRLEDLGATFAGRRVTRVDRTDGRKMIFGDGAWILLRASDTEPLIRCSIESRTRKDLETLTAAVRELITKG